MLSTDGSAVEAVGGRALGDPLPAARFDLFGMWIAAVPVVCWGAPLGSWAASWISTRRLLAFVVVMAVAEIITTAVFMPELHRPGALLAYALIGLAVLIAALYLMTRHRARIFRLPGLDLEQSISPDELDVAAGFQAQVRPRERERARQWCTPTSNRPTSCCTAATASSATSASPGICRLAPAPAAGRSARSSTWTPGSWWANRPTPPPTCGRSARRCTGR